MAEHTIWGSNAPAGWTPTLGTDGDPNIRLADSYYVFGTGLPGGATIVGGRVWTPVGSPASIKIMLFAGPDASTSVTTGSHNIDTTPVREVTVSTNPGGWTEGRWTTAYTPPNIGVVWAIGYEFPGVPDNYVFGTGITRPKIAEDGTKIALAELNASGSGTGGPSWFRIGTGAVTSVAGADGYYGTDTIIDISAGNTPPTANAGADQTVVTGQTVTLTGGGTDTDGTIVSYAWAQTSGTTVTLSGTGANRTFTPATTGVRTFQLTVTDDDGATGTDSVTITVNASGGGNTPPTANAGADQSVNTGDVVTLSGSASSDSDGTVVSYAWSQTSGPSVSLSGSGANRTFTPSVAGTYVFSLTVTDDDGATSSADSVTITATAPSGPLTVAQENAQSGHGPEHWMDGLDNMSTMPAFPRSTYYLPGQTLQMSINYNLPFTFDIYRLGHYGGSGGRRVALGVNGTPTAQPSPTLIANSNGAVTCAAWSVNGSWSIPVDAVPGWYSVTLKGTNGTDYGQVLFCVSDKNNKRPVVIVTGDATWHAAYNGFGGNNVYGASFGVGSAADRALCSTYDKPVLTRQYVPQTHFLNNTYPYLKWSESVGINAGYTTIEQIKNDPTILDDRDLVVWTGHNEYIPQQVMDKTKALLDAGCNMVNVAANDFFWRVKFTNGSFESTTNGRVMWCKKDSLAGPTAIRSGSAGVPFTTEAEWTGTWQDTRWSLREPSYEFLGDQFIANGIRADAVTVPSAMKTSPAWRNCPGIQALGIGQSYTFAAGTLGMEWDQPDPNTTLDWVPFSSTDILLTSNAADEDGAIYNETATGQHRFMALVSGNSYVVNFNSDQWAWALDSLHLRGSAASDINARQMMLNVLYDLGVTGNNTNIVATGLTVPTAVSNFGEAYGLPVIEPPPPPPPAGAHITVADTSTLNLTITGDGSAENPYVLSGVASPELGYSQSTQMFYSDGTQWHEL